MLNKNKTKYTLQILKKCLSSEWKCIYINTQAVNIYSTHANVLFQNLQARKKIVQLMVPSRLSCNFLFRDQEWSSLRESILDNDQEFTKRQDWGKSVRKHANCQNQKEQHNTKFWKKEFPPQAVLQRMVLTLPGGIFLQVFININISSTFPSYQLAGSPVWSLVQNCSVLNSQTQAAHPLQHSVPRAQQNPSWASLQGKKGDQKDKGNKKKHCDWSSRE